MIKIVNNFFTETECLDVIKEAKEFGFEPATINSREGKVLNTDYRNNNKSEFKDSILVDLLNNRLKEFDEVINQFDDKEFVGVNDFFRVYEYTEDQEFKTHKDSYFKLDDETKSEITLLIYLNEEVKGGETTIIMPYTIIQPETGKLLLFSHNLLHMGNKVLSGVKYVLRTDLMYKSIKNDKNK